MSNPVTATPERIAFRQQFDTPRPTFDQILAMSPKQDKFARTILNYVQQLQQPAHYNRVNRQIIIGDQKCDSPNRYTHADCEDLVNCANLLVVDLTKQVKDVRRERENSEFLNPPRSGSSADAAAAPSEMEPVKRPQPLPSTLSSPALSGPNGSQDSPSNEGPQDPHSNLEQNQLVKVGGEVNNVFEKLVLGSNQSTPGDRTFTRSPPPGRRVGSPQVTLPFTGKSHPSPDDGFFPPDNHLISSFNNTPAPSPTHTQAPASTPMPDAQGIANGVANEALLSFGLSNGPLDPAPKGGTTSPRVSSHGSSASSSSDSVASRRMTPPVPEANDKSASPRVSQEQRKSPEPDRSNEGKKVLEAPQLTHRVVRVNRPLWMATFALSTLCFGASAAAAAWIAVAVETPLLVSAVAFLGGPAVAIPFAAGVAVLSLATFVTSCLKLRKQRVAI